MTRLAAKRMTGEMVRFAKDRAAKGFGFVRTPDGRELFVHKSNFTDGPGEFDRLREGSIISFIEQASAKGPRAVDIEVESESAV